MSKQDKDQFELIEITVEDELAATEKNRLDLYLGKRIPEMSRARIQKLIDFQLVTVDGQVGKASQKLKGRELVSVRLPPCQPTEIIAEAIELDVVYEDDHLIVINKQAGLVTHPGAGTHSGTLVNALIYHCGSTLSGISGESRPGIVHRLDKDTSGLIVVAKNDTAHQSLANQIAEKSARRSYTALVDGVLTKDSGTIEEPIGRHPVLRKQMAVEESGRKARTHFRVLTRFAQFSLIRADLDTGRTHQIRVHLAHLGHPVAGDLVYNKKGSGGLSSRKKLGLSGHALHATSLSFTHPHTNELLEFKAPLPEQFAALITRLKR
ncbi:MAG: RluA family pseudouridine synthase [Candidatus Obscuribacterales bacterium]|nr:RluA family pseudouridine synthase [Candidatus Obscuribacterales bacterium]